MTNKKAAEMEICDDLDLFWKGRCVTVLSRGEEFWMGRIIAKKGSELLLTDLSRINKSAPYEIRKSKIKYLYVKAREIRQYPEDQMKP